MTRLCPTLAAGFRRRHPGRRAPARARAASGPREAPRPAVSEPKIEQIVVEDDAVRIEELRVRGETRKVIVKQSTGPPRL